MYFKKNALLHVIEIMGIVSSLPLVSGVRLSNSGSSNGDGVGMGPGNNGGGLGTGPGNNGGGLGTGPGNNGGGVGGGPGNNGPPVVTVQEAKCILQRIEPLMINEVDDDEVTLTVCEMDAAYEQDGISGITYTFDESTLPYGIFKNVEYSQTKMTISAAAVSRGNGKHGGGKIAVEHGATIKKETPSNGKSPHGKLRGNSNSLFDRRRLSQKTGNSTLIVLYAIPLDAVNDKRTSVELANDIFGINTTDVKDLVNVRSQMLACSRGQLNYLPACGTEEQSCFNEPLITDGILEVPIDKNVTGVKSGDVKNWVTSEAQVLLNGTGIDLFSFTQIMVVIPDEARWDGAAAWAYLPGQLSAFRDSYSYRMGTQMHEFGHNLGLHHSGYDGKQYRDHSCMMGSPSFGDDGPALCWNGAKSWETGWYSQDSVTVDPSTGAALFDLVGVADWVDSVYTSGDHNVVLEIQDSTEVQSFYVIYNRAKGPNNGVTFTKDEVTITTGSAKKVSWHQAGLGMPNPVSNDFPVFRKPNFNGSTKDLVVKVCGMTTGTQGVTPDLANVLVYLDDGPGLNNGAMCPGEFICIDDSDCEDGNYCTENSCDTTTFTCNAPLDISATQCPTCGDLTHCNPAGYCDPVCDDGKTCSDDSCVSGQCQHDPIPGCALHGGNLETWFNIDGGKVSDLTISYAYQTSSPDEVTTLQGSLKTGTSRGSDFGDRLRTFIYPATSGTYTFYVSSDDASELWLSTDDTPANKSMIAYVNSWTGDEEWDKYSSQKSDPVSLVAGSVYFLEVLHKENGGGDNLAVGWESADASVPLGVIGGSKFFVEPPVPCAMDEHCAAFITNPCNAGHCNIQTTFCEYIPMTGCENGGMLESWFGVAGNSIDDLTSDPRYPNSPNDTSILSNVLEAPSDLADSFGSRLQTYIMPPVTCDWNFFIASDDDGQLNLSNDTDPAHKATIAWVDGYTSERSWFEYTSQKSAPIHLEKGKLVYMEALHKDAGGGDNLAIGWECPEHDISLDVIDSSHTVVTPVSATPQPSNSPSKPLSDSPTTAPSKTPTRSPSKAPSVSPIPPTNAPTVAPTGAPTINPSTNPTTSPTPLPSNSPTTMPTDAPTTSPSKAPSISPTTAKPTETPTSQPTREPTSSPSKSPTASPTRSPSSSPTSQPSQAPTDAPITNMLQDAGDNGSPAEAFPLKKCQGDCDYDSNCEGELLCYQRSGYLAVPGCLGTGSSGKDYCAERSTPTMLFLRRKNNPLGACDGDCNSDADCEANLSCVAPDADMQVEGCDGLGVSGAKYCRYPSLAETGTGNLCDGTCNNDGYCEGSLECFLRIGTESVPGCLGEGISGAGYCTARPYNYLWIEAENGSPAEAFPLGVCEGSCNTDTDCEGNLICEVHSGDEEVLGCDGQGRTGINYCRYPALTNLGDNPSASYPLDLCEGDCDNDSQCQSGFLCYFRSNIEVVPGCSGDGNPGTDYCTERETNTTLFLTGNYGTILDLCEGDCDNDDECADSLVCFQRGGTQEVPGCDGLGASGRDYCYDASAGQ